MTANQIAALKHLAKNPLAQALFRELASRQRPRAVTDLRRLRQEAIAHQNIAATPSEVTEVFQGLAKEGFGKYVPAKKTAENDTDRFEWQHNYIELGRIALGRAGVAPEAKPTGRERIVTSYVTASGHRIRLEFSSRGEVDDFIRFLKSL